MRPRKGSRGLPDEWRMIAWDSDGSRCRKNPHGINTLYAHPSLKTPRNEVPSDVSWTRYYHEKASWGMPHMVERPVGGARVTIEATFTKPYFGTEKKSDWLTVSIPDVSSWQDVLRDDAYPVPLACISTNVLFREDSHLLFPLVDWVGDEKAPYREDIRTFWLGTLGIGELQRIDVRLEGISMKPDGLDDYRRAFGVFPVQAVETIQRALLNDLRALSCDPRSPVVEIALGENLLLGREDLEGLPSVHRGRPALAIGTKEPIGHERMEALTVAAMRLEELSGYEFEPGECIYKLGDISAYVSEDTWLDVWAEYPDWAVKAWMLADNGQYTQDDVEAMTVTEIEAAYADPNFSPEYAYCTDADELGRP